jgi:cytochrome c oxidase cbb3-type subunit 4
MDVNDLRIAVTLVSLLTFAGLLAWVGLARNRLGLDEAARLPFEGEDESS